MKKYFLFSGLLSFLLMNCSNDSNMQITDLHIHLKGGFTIQDAVEKSKKENIKYGIVTNCGVGFPVHNDSQIDSPLRIIRNFFWVCRLKEENGLISFQKSR
jgi:hypothetical protein